MKLKLMNKGRASVSAILILLIIASFGLLAGCGGDSGQTGETTAGAEGETGTAATEATEAKATDGEIKEAYAAYEIFLTDNASAIEQYENCPAVEYSMGKDKAVSFCDIDGNGIPELFAMMYSTESAGERGLLNIYTFSGGQVREVPYTIDRQENFDGGDKKAADYNVVAGGYCDYAAYTGKDGSLYIFSGSYNESSYSYLNRYTVGPGAALTAADQLYWAEVYDADGPHSEYRDNGADVPESDLTEKRDAAFSDLEQMIICGAGTYEGVYNNQIPLWTNLDETTPLNMSCQDAIAFVKEQQ